MLIAFLSMHYSNVNVIMKLNFGSVIILLRANMAVAISVQQHVSVVHKFACLFLQIILWYLCPSLNRYAFTLSSIPSQLWLAL